VKQSSQLYHLYRFFWIASGFALAMTVPAAVVIANDLLFVIANGLPFVIFSASEKEKANAVKQSH
jgi:hypothetical protein